MFLGYFVGHDGNHLSWLVIINLLKIFLKYNKNPSFMDLKEFSFYFILLRYVILYVIFVSISYFMIVYEKQNLIISL